MSAYTTTLSNITQMSSSFPPLKIAPLHVLLNITIVGDIHVVHRHPSLRNAVVCFIIFYVKYLTE